MPLTGLVEKIPTFFNWFIKFLAKPLGIATWSIVLIILAGFYGDFKRQEGSDENKQQIHKDSARIISLENKIESLSDKLSMRDCTGEVEKYMNLIQTLQIQTSQNKEEMKKRLDLERQKTKELENLKQTLNPR